MKIFLRSCSWIVITILVILTLFFLMRGHNKGLFFSANSVWHPLFKTIGLASQKEPIQEVLKSLDPSFAATLKSMYDRQPQVGTDGSMHALDGVTKIPPELGMWIYELCRKVRPKQTLEIGFGNGFSTIFFLAAIKANRMGSHVAMDPFEITDFHGIGLKKAQELGMHGSLCFIEKKDVFGLPELAQEGKQFEVIFIDGDHRFEYVLLDFFLGDYVCAKEGYIIFDDFDMPSVKKAVSFIATNRSDYKKQDTPLDRIAVFKKVGDDRRQWTHFVPF